MPTFNNNRPLRILVICNKMPYPSNDGGTIATLNMIMGLTAQGNEVDVLAMQTQKHNFPLEKLSPELTQNINWHSVWIDTDVKIVKLISNLFLSKKPYNAERFMSEEFSKKLIWLLQNNYDIIQLEGLYLSCYIPTIRKCSKSAISMRAHNVEWQIWERMAQTEHNPVKKLYKKILCKRVRALEMSALKNIDLLVPITKNDAEKLPFRPDCTYVAPTGIEPQKFYSGNAPEIGKSFFYIGALDWEPNQEAIMWFVKNVWADIHKQYPEWTFHIAGRNAPSGFVTELKKNPVEYDGQVPSAREFISKYNIMIVPLLSGSGMRIKIIEAMAHTRCVITTPIGAEGIDAENGKHLLIGSTPEELKDLITKVIESPKMADEIASEAFVFTNQHFNNRHIIDGLDKFYKQWLQR